MDSTSRGTTSAARVSTGSGGASRFFYAPKPSKRQRDAGLAPLSNGHPVADAKKRLRYWSTPDRTATASRRGSGGKKTRARASRKGLAKDTAVVRRKAKGNKAGNANKAAKGKLKGTKALTA